MVSAGDDSKHPKPAKQAHDDADRHDIGAALRVAYREAMEETVPVDLLELLGKLD